MKPILVLSAIAIAMIFGLLICISYGNPHREIASSGSGARYDLKKAFWVESCDIKGNCKIANAHEKVMHFWFGDGIKASSGSVKGKGHNPIAALRRAGFGLLPEPDYTLAALKWCTRGPIWQEFEYHGQHFIVPLTHKPVETARCVQDQLPRNFSVSIADPLGRDENSEVFAVLEID